MKYLKSLKTYDPMNEKKEALEEIEQSILNTRNDLSDLRQKLNDKQEAYRKNLADDSVSIEELESLKSEIEEIEEKIPKAAEELKNLQAQKPKKEESFEAAKDDFIKEAKPVIDEAFEDLAATFEAFEEKHKAIWELRKESADTPLPSRLLPTIPKKHVTVIGNMIPFKRNQWSEAAE